MKFIREYVENIEPVIVENKEGGKDYFLEGIFLQGNKENKNNRNYPVATLEKAVNEFNTEYVSKKRGFGELGHPAGPQINLERVSHMITDIKKAGDNFIGRAKVMDTPYGNIVKNFIKEGCLLGVSSRGLGSVNDKNTVQDDYKLATVDIVADPSAPDAFVEGIMESHEWYVENGIYKVREIEEIQNEVNETPKYELQEKKIELFEKFINGL